MAIFGDRIKVACSTTGSTATTLTLGSAVSGFQTLSEGGLSNGDSVRYVIEDGSNFEIGLATYATGSPDTLTGRSDANVSASSSSNNRINLSGSSTLFIAPTAADLQTVHVYSATSDLPSASDNHGMIAHVHGEGAMYFAHSNSWVKIANYSDITTYTHPNHSGEVTSTGDGATVIADNVVDESNLKVSNAPTDGYVLTARSGNTGGMTWEAASGGGGSSTSALTETTFSATANQTAFPVSGGITNAANISVFQNGVKLEEGAGKDYTASASTNTVTLNSGAAAGDVVEVLEYGQPNSITDLSDTPSSLGSAGQVLQVASNGSSLEFADASSGSGVTVYTGLSGTDGTPANATYLLNASSPSAGDLAYVSSNTSLYQNNGNGWYRIAVINTTPTISSVADASSNTTPFTLVGGTNTVITVTASDADEGTDLTYTHSVTSGSLNGTTVTQGTGANENVFTIAPHASNATTFSITFTVSDSINAATSVAAFTLDFVVTDSHFTSLLMATDGSAGDNNDITDSSSSSHTITVNGDAHAGSFSPYRHGGYSYEFDGSTDSIRADDHTDFDWSSNGFTIECWINMKAMPSGGVMTANHQVLFSKWNAYSNNREFLLSFGSNGTLGLVLSTDGTNYTTTTSSNNVLSLNTWHHICYEFNGSSHIVYVDGTAEVTVNNSSVPYAGNMPFGIGYSISGGNTALHIVPQSFVTDVRVVNGSTVYGGAFTPQTERLTAVTNTKLLTCHLPYISDTPPSGGTAKTLTINGNPETKPFGPYDYLEYDKSTDGGSVYFDGSDYLQLSATATDLLPETSSTTIEAWVNTTGTGHVSVFSNFNPSSPFNGMEVGLYNGYQTIYSQGSWINNTGGTGVSTINDGSWHHLAWVITNSGATVTTYVDGVQNYTSSINASTTGSSNQRIGASSNSTVNRHFTGYISDVRFVKGTAVYSGAFTPPTGPLTSTGGTYSSTTNVDTSITASNTSLLLKGTDAHVIDKSQGNNLKLIGTAASTSALTSGSTPPYIGAAWANTSAVSFDGNSDYVIMPQISLGSGDFTIEAYTYLDARLTSYPAIFSNYNSFAAGALGLFAGHGSSTTTNYQVAHNGAGFPSINGGPITYDQWVHLCVERYNGTITLYKDGSSVNSFASTVSLNGVGSNFYIGTTGDSISTSYINGWIQDFRVTVGRARYQGAFTKPAAPLKG